MLDQNDPAVRAYEQAPERAKAAEEGDKSNIRLFTEMYLALGADAAKLGSDGSEGTDWSSR